MDRIVKGVILGGKARIAVLDTTASVNHVIALRNLSPLAAAVLGRSLTAGAYLSAGLKNANDRFSLVIDGKGPAGKVVIAGESGGIVRGFIENPYVDLPPKKGKLDVGGAVGINGELTVIKDLGLKEPYVGRCALVTGEIAEDFAGYLLKSEGIPSAVALGVLADANGCRASGGIIVEAMPDASDEDLFVLEDIMTNFANVSTLLAEKSAEEIADFFFRHLDAQIFPAKEIKYLCRCGEKIDSVVRSLGRAEAEQLAAEPAGLEIKCDFCGKAYRFAPDDLDGIFGRK